MAEQKAFAETYSIDTNPNDADQAVEALLGGVAWATTSLTFSFPNSASDYFSTGTLNNKALARSTPPK